MSQPGLTATVLGVSDTVSVIDIRAAPTPSSAPVIRIAGRLRGRLGRPGRA